MQIVFAFNMFDLLEIIAGYGNTRGLDFCISLDDNLQPGVGSSFINLNSVGKNAPVFVAPFFFLHS